MKWLVLFVISFSAFAQQDCGEEEKILFSGFFPTRTLLPADRRDVNIAFILPAVTAVKNFQLANPKAKISAVKVESCTSSFKLPPKSKTELPDPVEHLSMAAKRLQLAVNEFGKEGIKIVAGHKECSPAFVEKDKNLRFAVEVPGVPKTTENFNSAVEEIFNGDELFKLYQDYWGIPAPKDDKEKNETISRIKDLVLNQLKTIHPDAAQNIKLNPFHLKYMIFEGYSVNVTGSIPCKGNTKPKPKSGTQTSIK